MAEEAEPQKETLRFLTPEKCFEVREKFGSPCYVYDEASLRAQAAKAVAFPNAYGLHARFAMKAAPNAANTSTKTPRGSALSAPRRL